jgi:hypothetical protein
MKGGDMRRGILKVILFVGVGTTGLMTGCMSTSPRRFHAPAKIGHFDLATDAVDTTAKNILGEHIKQTLKAGHYIAAFENTDYLFYECASECVLWGFGTQPLRGGICLPKPGSKAIPYLWVYVSRSTKDLGLIGNFADKAEAGNIRVLHYASAPSQELLKMIVVKDG